MIGIDITATQNQYKDRGIGVLTRKVVEEMVKKIPGQIVLFGLGNQTDLQEPAVKFVSIGRLKPLSVLTRPLYKRDLYEAVVRNRRKEGYRIHTFFSPFIHAGVPYIPGVQTYAYVHDMIQKESGTYTRKNNIVAKVKSKQYAADWKALGEAKGIITPSNTVKHVVMKYLGKSNITVAYPGVDHEIYNRGHLKNPAYIEEHYGVEGKYILYFGGDEPNKNIELVIDAYALYRERCPEDPALLVIAGGGFSNQKNYVKKKYPALLPFVIFTGYIPDDEKIYVIVNASICIHLSLNEGFGLAVLEAMACGIPCILSDISAYREVFGSNALIVPLTSKVVAADSAATHICAIMQDTKMRQVYSELAYTCSNTYTWEKTAKSILSVLQDGL